MSIELPAVFWPEEEPVKFLATLKRRVSKNFRWTSLRSLHDAVVLAYCLYVAGREDQALEVCRFLSPAPLPDKVNSCLWGWVQNSLALQSRLAHRRGLKAEAAECRERIWTVSLFEYRLTGKVLSDYERDIQDALDFAERCSVPIGIFMERSARLNALIELCVMIELGVSPDLTVPSPEEKLEENKARLQEMICRPSKSRTKQTSE